MVKIQLCVGDVRQTEKLQDKQSDPQESRERKRMVRRREVVLRTTEKH
jgi:hypothetical protein